MTAPVRVGMVGSGFMARLHSAAYQLLPITYGSAVPRIELTRIAGGRGAAEAAQRFGWREVGDDWRSVTEADDVDVVDIVTPNHTHPELAISAARHGKHIVCEKPLAASYSDALRMSAAAMAADVRTAACFVYRTWPAVQTARSMIAGGDIGAVHGYRGHFLHDHLAGREAANSWRFDRKRAGAGVIGDIGSHALDIARYLLGDIGELHATSRTVLGARDADSRVDDEADILVRFRSGATGHIWLSWLATGTPMSQGFRVMGDRGSIAFDWSRPNELAFYDGSAPADRRGFTTIPIGPAHTAAQAFWPIAGVGIGYQESFVVLLGQFFTGLSEGRQVAPSFAEAAVISGYIDNALESAESGNWVRFGG